MFTRREFIKLSSRAGIGAATLPLWSHEICAKAFAQQSLAQYKAVVVVHLNGGNDGNNMVVPLTTATYDQYALLRGRIALPQSSLLPLAGTDGSGFGPVGMHPSLVNIARKFNQRQAIVVANVGPMVKKLSKTELLGSTSLQPEGLFSHATGLAQWQSASTVGLPDTGWGGRIADLYSGQSGDLPPAFTASGSTIFTVGHTVQGVAIQAQAQGGGAVAIPAALQSAVRSLAQSDMRNNNLIVAQVARLRESSMAEQALLLQATQYGPQLTPVFSTTALGVSMKMIAQIINGRSVIGANRQLFYCVQEGYDNHQSLQQSQGTNLADLDTNIGAFLHALDEMGLANQVLICTHSDFNRTMQGNINLGSDHGWGNHQIILGGGILGGRILGDFPDLELGGSSDFGTQGLWIPTTSVTQMTAGIGSWMGLDDNEVNSVFPDLANFSGYLRYQ